MGSPARRLTLTQGHGLKWPAYMAADGAPRHSGKVEGNMGIEETHAGLTRRSFVTGAMAAAAAAWAAGAHALAPGRAWAQAGQADEDTATQDQAGKTEGGQDASTDALDPLPTAQPDPDDQFGVDANINMATIDAWLGRPDVAYRDMRLIFDPARWEDVDEDPYASKVLPGFKMVPFPYLATMAPIPVTEYYEGDTLFTCEWSDEGELLGVKGNYKESMTILRELFPQDEAIFLCCGGAGYASFTKKLLLFLGWDPALVYNVGGMWYYEGDQAIDLIEYGAKADDDLFATWRADYTLIDFTLLRPESVKYQDHR